MQVLSEAKWTGDKHTRVEWHGPSGRGKGMTIEWNLQQYTRLHRVRTYIQ
jgi:predicted mannosyl-3-phosphoglycerate phosphatase (HAD superfamily)